MSEGSDFNPTALGSLLPFAAVVTKVRSGPRLCKSSGSCPRSVENACWSVKMKAGQFAGQGASFAAMCINGKVAGKAVIPMSVSNVRTAGSADVDHRSSEGGYSNVGPVQYQSPMRPLELRTAHTSDYDEIADVWHASASLPGVGPEPMVSRQTLRIRIEPEVENGWDITVATIGGEIVGFLAINAKKKVLSQIFVRPDHVGSGLGSRLLRLAMKQMPSGFSLSTASTNSSGRKFYKKSGLTLTRVGVHPRTGHEISFYEWKRQ